MKFQCSNPKCSRLAEFQCPICQKQGNLDSSHFCSQECYKVIWPSHRAIHTAYNPWPNYKFTGPLRPYPYGPKRTADPKIPCPDYAASGVPASELDYKNKAVHTIPILTQDEQEKMRLACRLTREVLDEAAKVIRPGITGDYIDEVVHEECLRRDCYPSPLNYQGFPKSCCISVNEVICHGIPDLRPLSDGDIVNLDISAFHNGYHGDVNATYAVGTIDAESQRLIDCAKQCLEVAIEQVRPGVAFKELGSFIEKQAKSSGFSVVKSFCGHGIGTLFHGPPSIPHYAKNRCVGIIREGMVFTIEPMINAGHWQDTIWPDNWTAVTADGKRSAQFEHTLLVTKTGCEILTSTDGRF